MKLTSILCISALALAAAPVTVDRAIAADCSQGFFKSNVKGTPTNSGSSFTYTTKVIKCPPASVATTVVTLSDRKAMTPKPNEAEFSYICAYNPPIP